jgi:hypothetical protein
VKRLFHLMRFRNRHGAFGTDAHLAGARGGIEITVEDSRRFSIARSSGKESARLDVDLSDTSFAIYATERPGGALGRLEI